MLSFSLVAEALTDLIYHRPSGENFSFVIQTHRNPNVLTVKDHMLQTIKGVQLIKNRCSVNMWWTTKKSYASILKQNSALPPQPKGDTFTFTADQLVKFVATVAIQIAQPQVCYTTAPKDAVHK